VRLEGGEETHSLQHPARSDEKRRATDDAELDRIRQKRMAELRAQNPQLAGMGGGGMPSQKQMQEQQERQAAAEEQRAQILKAVLAPEARERCNSSTHFCQRCNLFLMVCVVNWLWPCPATDVKRSVCAVSTIAMVKSDKARKIEDMLIMQAQRGTIGGQVTDQQLVEMLEGISEQSRAASKVTIQRRRAFDDDDDW
jgi:DNA-binding TFAR19-related protein (PDSD5 family)